VDGGGVCLGFDGFLVQVPGSASSYSVGAHSYTMGEKVAQSASLYSMSSGSSCASGEFRNSVTEIV
jgi:hypothetical protein